MSQPEVPRQRFLIIDADRDHTSLLAQLLEMDGHEVRVASDGRSGLELAIAWRPDAVLMDTELDGIQAAEMVRQLRQKEWGQQMLLVVLTSWISPQRIEAARQAGFDAFLAKPASAQAMGEALTSKPGRPFFVRIRNS